MEHSGALHVQEILQWDNRARFVKELFPREFAETDIATIKNFRIDPLKPPIPIDELEDANWISIIRMVTCKRVKIIPSLSNNDK
jgi:hypothetical protein